MEVLNTISARVVNALPTRVVSAGSTVKSFIVGEKSTFKTTDDVLRAEYELIFGGKPLPKEDFEAAYRAAVQTQNQAALCLSGGGIRSAAFSLGVLQVLANRGLLTQFHYLSTVSGGGYIGGWLSRWISEDPQQNAANIEKVLARKEEILQISGLRANSNFLTPKTGITSADTWTGILLWVRNVLLNWTVFIPALVFAVLAPNVYLALVTWFAALGQAKAILFGFDLALVLLWVASASLTIATWQAAHHLPSHRKADDCPSSTVINLRIVVPLLLWAGMVPLVLVAGNFTTAGQETIFRMFGWDLTILAWLLVFSFGAKLLGYVIGALTNLRDVRIYLKNALTWIVVSAIATGALWLAVTIIANLAGLLPASADLFSERPGLPQVDRLVFTFAILGPLGATLAHLLLSTLYVGFRKAGFQDDADREWLARVSAVCVFPTLIWAVFALICLFLPLLFLDNEWLRNLSPTLAPTIDGLVKALGVISGFFAVLGGKSASVKLDISNAAPKSNSTKAYELAVQLATLFFIAFVFMVLAYLERTAAEALVRTAAESGKLGAVAVFVIPRILVFLAGFVPLYVLWYLISREAPALRAAIWLLVIFSAYGFFAHAMGMWVVAPHSAAKKIMIAHGFIAAGLFLIVTIASSKIDVNRFSMHGVYRNRLVRGFLGAARAGRKADLFTDFDAADNLRMSELQGKKERQARSLSGHQCDAESGRRRKPRLAGAQGELLHYHADLLR